jgi:hypothetical protein
MHARNILTCLGLEALALQASAPPHMKPHGPTHATLAMCRRASQIRVEENKQSLRGISASNSQKQMCHARKEFCQSLSGIQLPQRLSSSPTVAGWGIVVWMVVEQLQPIALPGGTTLRLTPLQDSPTR